jgi:hypothetical protein
VFLVRTSYGTDTVNDYDEVLSRVSELTNSPPAVRPTRIYLVPPLNIDLRPALKYFAPEAETIYAKPPVGEKIAGAYVFSYVNDAADRVEDAIYPNRHPRPFIKMDKE